MIIINDQNNKVNSTAAQETAIDAKDNIKKSQETDIEEDEGIDDDDDEEKALVETANDDENTLETNTTTNNTENTTTTIINDSEGAQWKEER